jgi:hypothetical protein
MRVFVLMTGYPYETAYFRGVFSTREKAVAYYESLETSADMEINDEEIDERCPTKATDE